MIYSYTYPHKRNKNRYRFIGYLLKPVEVYTKLGGSQYNLVENKHYTLTVNTICNGKTVYRVISGITILNTKDLGNFFTFYIVGEEPDYSHWFSFIDCTEFDYEDDEWILDYTKAQLELLADEKG